MEGKVSTASRVARPGPLWTNDTVKILSPPRLLLPGSTRVPLPRSDVAAAVMEAEADLFQIAVRIRGHNPGSQLQAPNSGHCTTHSDCIGSDVIPKLIEATLAEGRERENL